MADKQLETFKQELKDHGLRITNSRLAVFAVLNQQKNSFLTPDQIFEELERIESQCDRVSVYRILKTLEDINLVKVSHFQGEASKYQLHMHDSHCNHDHEAHEHFFKCVGCGHIEAIGTCLVDDSLKDLNARGFKTLSHHLEVSGQCPKCQ